jgi:NADH:ubiquinone oxidoreductase subunit E
MITDDQGALRAVAKYPADQKQSAVMACLSIVQQEQGWVSQERAEIADYLGMGIAVHESPLSTTCTTSSRWASTS